MAGNDTKSTLLCHWNGPDGAKEIVDDGNTGHIVTLVGTAQTSTTQKKIGNCSLYLDGNSDYITAPDSANWQLGGGTGNFTVEFYVRFATTASSIGIMSHYQDDNNYWFLSWYKPSDQFIFGAITSGSYTIRIDGTWQPAADTWYHIAIVRTGTAANTLKIYIDGVDQAYSLTYGAWDGAFGNYAGLLSVGRNLDTNNWYTNGYIDECRISSIARYSAAFTPSTIAFTSDTACSLLLHMESHDIALGGSYLPATFVGTAQLDTAVKTFGTASLLLDGDSDIVTFPDNAIFDFSTNDFTIDFRFRMATIASNQYDPFDMGGYASNKGVLISIQTNAGPYFVAALNGNAVYVKSWSPSADTWYHCALCRSASTLTAYIDGTSLGDVVDSTDIDAGTNGLYIGARNGSSKWWNGYIDELRISRTCRWTANFTPPSAEYSEDTPVPTSTRRIFLIT